MATRSLGKAFERVFYEALRPSFAKSHRTFVTDKSDEKVEKTCDQVTEAADAVKKGAAQVTNMTKDVRGKVSEATDSITKKAKDDVVDVAGKKLKQKVVDK
ncbi:hypothetical protein L1987_65060 [Smallanthus sonchifolius]|uniref:Uncharacterized protein n=1 Tax=Smallanthus sonchifolius TaxID=185202 RepID=A0ACB9BTH1_9ASTR|nr:hypothetical protein L1987_65060 [Smallanthus sonchifolius]